LRPEVKAYDAETKRISAVQAGMSEEQIQDMCYGNRCSGNDSQSDLINEMPWASTMDMMPQEDMKWANAA
jgi:hypothetical protein